MQLIHRALIAPQLLMICLHSLENSTRRGGGRGSPEGGGSPVCKNSLWDAVAIASVCLLTAVGIAESHGHTWGGWLGQEGYGGQSEKGCVVRGYFVGSDCHRMLATRKAVGPKVKAKNSPHSAVLNRVISFQASVD